MLRARNGINGVRIVLVSLVVLSHSFALGAAEPSPILLGSTAGGWALAGLFAVSGYLVAGGRDRLSYIDFTLQRVGRLWPAYMACLAVIAFAIAPMGYVLQHGSIDGYLTHPDGGPIRFLSMNALFEIEQPTISGTPYARPSGWIGNLWTVLYTVLSYLVVGALLGLRSLRARLVGVTAALVLATVGYANRDVLVEIVQDSRITDGLLRFLPYFLGGVLVHLVRDRIRLAWPLAAVSLLVILGAAAWLDDWGLQAAAPCMAYLLLFLGDRLPLPSLLRRHDVTFGIFMYSYAVQALLAMTWTGAGVPAFFVVSLLATLPLAIASWLLVERPLKRRRDRLRARVG